MTAPTGRIVALDRARPNGRARVAESANDPRVVIGDAPPRRLLGQSLVARQALSDRDLATALELQSRQDARLGDILVANNMVSEGSLLSCLSEQWDTDVVDLSTTPPDPRLLDSYGISRCFAEGLVPWQRAGSTVIVATTRPEKFENHRGRLEACFGSVTMALTTEVDLHAALATVRNPEMVNTAETRVPLAMSCRGWDSATWARRMLAACAGAVALALAFPVFAFSILAGWAILTLIASAAVKTAALAIALFENLGKRPAGDTRDTPEAPAIARLPTVSMMVALFREEDITGKLVSRLERLDYPKELLDILLVVEEDDTRTNAALAQAQLPRWIRVVTVPRGGVKTKPRALNYALDFCRGQIVGVWDAEDAPDPDQLQKVVRRFHERGRDLACLQGRLDYYNARTNWLSRCFTIEYAGWFGVVLPGLQRLGFAMPLGGTTLFFRRDVLEELGGWDAHNVTEDADLGMRLVRMGYRTEMVDTTTGEEANCRVLPWIRQRSRWLKGYAMTWAVHSRRPRELMKDLGAWKFTGFQILFLGTLSQFVLAPVLWSFWLLAFGLPHPLSGLIPTSLYWPLMGVFVFSELMNLSVGAFAVRGTGRRFLIPWVVTQHFYYPLAAFASYKAFYEILTRPFYWDKTSHGLHAETDDTVETSVANPA